jgi:hypothetical protein
MAKLFESSADVIELAENKFDETTLSDLGINLKVISTAKAKAGAENQGVAALKIKAKIMYKIKAKIFVSHFKYKKRPIKNNILKHLI